LTVEDNGIGISPEDQQDIFTSFKQINRPSIEQQGIGLGLALARSLVRLLGGDISVESEVGQGSTFTVSLAG
jgi:signal transduction histidine kinase